MEDTLVHELVHMYDHCKFKVDWSNLRHHACSEVRNSIYLFSIPNEDPNFSIRSEQIVSVEIANGRGS